MTVKKPTQTCGVEPEMAVKPGNLPPNAVPASFPGSLLTTQPTLPELQQPPAQPQSLLNKNVSLQFSVASNVLSLSKH